jgi:hypothetical protein
MPSGVQLSLTKSRESCFSFVLTDATGKRMYGCSLLYYEPAPQGALAKSSIIPPNGQQVYGSKSICVMSHLPFHRAMREWLCSFYARIAASPEKPMDTAI